MDLDTEIKNYAKQNYAVLFEAVKVLFDFENNKVNDIYKPHALGELI